MSHEESGIIAFVNTIGGDVTAIITTLENAGFQRREEFGTVVLTAPFSFLGKVTQGLVRALEQFQLAHRLWILVDADSLDQSTSDADRLEAFKWWEIHKPAETVVVYDLQLTNRHIGSGLRYMLEKAGAAGIFSSCHSIIRADRIVDLRAKLDGLVLESNSNPKRNSRTGAPIEYHGEFFHGYLVGTPRVIQDWISYKVKILLEKFQRIRDQARGWEMELQKIPAELDWHALCDGVDTASSAITTLRRLRRTLPDLMELVEIYEKLGLTNVMVTNTYTPPKTVRERLGNVEESTYTGALTDITRDIETVLDEIQKIAEDTRETLKARKDLESDQPPTRKLRLLARTLDTTEKTKQRSLTHYF